MKSTIELIKFTNHVNEVVMVNPKQVTHIQSATSGLVHVFLSGGGIVTLDYAGLSPAKALHEVTFILENGCTHAEWMKKVS